MCVQQRLNHSVVLALDGILQRGGPFISAESLLSVRHLSRWVRTLSQGGFESLHVARLGSIGESTLESDRSAGHLGHIRLDLFDRHGRVRHPERDPLRLHTTPAVNGA